MMMYGPVDHVDYTKVPDFIHMGRYCGRPCAKPAAEMKIFTKSNKNNGLNRLYRMKDCA